MDNIKITLPISGLEVELKPYINAREQREIRNILLASTNLSPTGQGITGVNPQVINQAEDKAFEIIVVSIQGVVEGKLEKILEFHSVDYGFLLKKVEAISQGISEEKKT